MKKYFSRIIIPLFIIAIAFGGFDVSSTNKIYAASTTPAVTDTCATVGKPGSALQTQCYIDRNCAGKSGSEYDACRQPIVDGMKKILEGNITNDTGNWFIFAEGLKNFGSALADGAIRTAMAIIGAVWQLILIPVLALITKISSYVLDFSTTFTLEFTKNTDIFNAVQKVWVIIRNLFNITFIFILLFTSIKTIIGSSTANTKKTIANVIIAALLINFSLFITKVIIDAGNILAVAIYNLATSNGTFTLTDIMGGALGLSGLFSVASVGSVFSSTFFIITTIQALVMLVAIGVFFYIAGLMLARTVMLIFLMALSPIGFMGDILPSISEYSKMWWTNLNGQVFIAPIFLLFFYLIELVAQSLTPSTVANVSNDYIAYFRYIIIMVLLVAAVKVAKSMSGVVGGAVEKLGSLAAGAAIGVATGGAAFAGRTIIGRGAAKLASGEALTNAAAQKGVGGIAARMALKGLNTTSKASFDVRNTDSFKSTMGLTGLKIDTNKGMAIQKDGYQGMVKRSTDKDVAMTKTINEAEIKIDPETIKKALGEKTALNNAKISANEEEIRLLDGNKERLSDEDKAKLEKLKNETKALKEAVPNEEATKKEMIDAEKKRRADTYAETTEKSILNKLFRNKKDNSAAVKKIKETIKPKDGKTLAAEAAKQIAKEEAENEAKPEAAKAGGNTPTSTAGGSSSGGTSGKTK